MRRLISETSPRGKLTFGSGRARSEYCSLREKKPHTKETLPLSATEIMKAPSNYLHVKIMLINGYLWIAKYLKFVADFLT